MKHSIKRTALSTAIAFVLILERSIIDPMFRLHLPLLVISKSLLIRSHF